MDQIVIALTGVIALYLLMDKRENVRKWAPIVGLIGQPFWLWATWKSGMGGMFIISVLYTIVWIGGLLRNFTSQGDSK